MASGYHRRDRVGDQRPGYPGSRVCHIEIQEQRNRRQPSCTNHERTCRFCWRHSCPDTKASTRDNSWERHLAAIRTHMKALSPYAMTRLRDGTVRVTLATNRGKMPLHEMRRALIRAFQPRVKKRYRFRELESVRIPVRHIGDDHETDIFDPACRYCL